LEEGQSPELLLLPPTIDNNSKHKHRHKHKHEHIPSPLPGLT
jgi:hypothetical protein